MRPPPTARPAPTRRISRAVACALAAALAAGCVSGPPGHAPEVSDADRARYVRRRLEDSRALLAEGRAEHAEGHLRRGLAILPDDPQLNRELARLLEQSGRADEAAQYRRRADAVDPVEPLSDAPLAASAESLLVALVPSEGVRARPGAIAPEFASREATDALRERLRVRLPGAMFVPSDAASTADARRFLARYAPRAVVTLRLDRAYCGESIKDGPFAVSWLRVAAETPGRPVAPATTVKASVSHPDPARCEREALEHAFESALAEPSVNKMLLPPDGAAADAAAAAARYTRSQWSREAIRALFPLIESRIREHIEVGRVRLAAGEIGEAAEAFQRAVHVDPEDPYARAYLHEAETTLAMVRELAARAGNRAPSVDARPDAIDPRLSPAQAAAAEARLAEERRRRTELLAALAVLDEDVEMPSDRLRAAFRPASTPDPEAFGPREAERRAGGAVEARAAYAPDGSVLARYYYATGGDLPVLREEDTDGDRKADRWIGYTGRYRAEIWEDAADRGTPDRHFVFAAGGTPLERIEIDADGDARPERVFHYEDGVLAAEDTDTDGDGAIDRFDRLDARGVVVQRGEDLNGDGEIDVRDSYEDGKLVRREILDPDVAVDAVRNVTPRSRTPM